jgi:hypothetical protein
MAAGLDAATWGALCLQAISKTDFLFVPEDLILAKDNKGEKEE